MTPGARPCHTNYSPHFVYSSFSCMACSRPLNAFLTGTKTENGKDDYVIGRFGDKVFPVKQADKLGHRVSPSAPMAHWNGESYLVDPVPIPCGHCAGCRLDRAREWKNRCVIEAKYHPCSYFVTLTYDDAHVPMTSDGKPFVSKKDFQKFMKRLRTYSGADIRFFACSEYGTLNGRPHYHAIIFGDAFPDKTPEGLGRFKSAILTAAWPFGLTDLAVAEPGSMAYVAGYVEKKQNDPHWDDYPVKPFLLMSRRPGIGTRYVTDGVHDIKSSRKIYGAFGGKTLTSAPVPRLFAEKVGKTDPSWLASHKAANVALALRMEGNKINAAGTTDYESVGDLLDSRHRATVTQRKRKL